MAEWDDEVDELYGLDPGEFVAARNALAKQIRAGGDKARAAEVAKLARPTVVAWALNQAARRDPDRVAALVDAAERVATAQSDLMAGGDPAELRAATTAQRAAAAEVVHTAVGLAGAAHADAIRTTLDAALARPGLTERLTAGTLSDTLDAPAGFGFGFDDSGGGGGGGATVTDLDARRRSRAAGRKTATNTAGEATPTADDRAAARAARTAAARAVAALEKELAKAEKTTDRRAAALEGAEQQVADAEAALVEAQRSVDDAAENRDDAVRELESQRAEQERVAAELTEARATLDGLR